MSVTFKQKDHSYQSLDPNERINWISVTRFIEKFKETFDALAQSEKSSTNPRSKWFGIPPEIIRKHWANEGVRGRDEGSFYHDQRESDLLEINTLQRRGINIPIIPPIFIDNIKHAPVQRLTEGIYPEHFMYLKSVGLCGQADRIEVIKDIVDVIDYKTCKKIDMKSWVNWEGVSKKMLSPLEHLDDCHINHHALQLSLYLYMVLKHNPRYKPGKMFIHHVIFEKEGDDQFGFPILKRSLNGEHIVKTVIPYEVPYLKTEVRNMIKWLENNPQ